MRQKNERRRDEANCTVKDIRRKTRKRYSSEDKIRIVLAGLRGEDSIAELCRQEGIAQSQYYSWSKEFMEAGRKRLAGDTARKDPTTPEKVASKLLADGNGSIAVLRVLQNSDVEHSIIGVNKGGVVSFIDPQRGSIVTLQPSVTAIPGYK
ncbi:transposase-like protein [Labrenzia sp. EL_195]|nr:transposase-like protein [Labrenzia sp. EL_195]